MYCCAVCAQLCLTLHNPMDCSLPRSSVHGISRARILEWIAIPFSRRSSRPRDQTWVFCIADLYHRATGEAQSNRKSNRNINYLKIILFVGKLNNLMNKKYLKKCLNNVKERLVICHCQTFLLA